MRGYLQLYSNGVAFGTACDGYLGVWGGAPLYATVANYCGIPCIAFGYLTVPTTVTTLTIQTTYSNMQIPGYINIEVVSNNNTITAFTGATSTTNGIVGYIPAPPAGTQNSYLRGDGTWQQANNAPTAAQYYMTTQPSTRNATYNTLFEFSTTPLESAGNAITQLSPTQFQLAAGYTYKLSGTLLYGDAGVYETICQWSTTNNTTGIIGVAGDCGGNQNQNSIATAYLTAKTIMTVGLVITYARGVQNTNSVVIAGESAGRLPWISIEVVSNNNTITQFTGCTAYQNGSIGYVPAPALGDQTKFLCANGTWSPSVTAGPDVSVAGSTVSLSATLNSVTTLNNVAKLTGLSAPVTGPDAANKTYVDAQDALKLSLSGGTMSGALNMGGNKVSVTYTPTATTDVPNKTYVDTQVATKVSLAGGMMTGAINMGGQTISNAASLAINGTSSSDALTLSKATGGVAYTLALPAAAPAANTYLGYNGTNYTWGAGTNSAAQFLHVANTTSLSYPVNTFIAFPTQVAIAPGTTAIAYVSASSTFTLQAGYTYKLTGAINYAATGGTYQWYNVTTPTYLGTGGNGGNSTWAYVCSIATAYITPSVTTSVALYCVSANTLAVTIGTSLCTWATIEVVSNNNTISQFTGATSAAPGAIGYIPAPQAGQQNYVLSGSGSWASFSNYFAPVTLSNQNAVGFINIPSSATEITVMFKGVTIPQLTADFVVQLGYGTGPTYLDNGYTGIASNSSTSYNNLVTTHSTGFGIWSNNTITSFTGFMKIILLDPVLNTWIATLTGAIIQPTLTGTEISSSYMSLTSGPLTAIRVMASAGNSAVKFSGGTINVKYTS